MIRKSSQDGFTAVELLITLFVAAAFLVAGYQLFNLIIIDGGNTRVESSASNVAYDHLRRYADSSATNPCTPSTPLADAAVTIEGAANSKVSISITCPQADAPTLSKVEAAVSYGLGAEANTVKYATYVDKSRGATPNTDITNGLMEWWQLNGNTNSSAGATTLINEGVTSAAGQDGNPVGAYGFVAANQKSLRGENFSAKMVGLSAFSITGWVNPPNNPGAHNGLYGFRDDTLGGAYTLQVTGTNNLECRIRTNSSTYYQAPTLALTPNTWQLVSLVFDGANLRCYVNNTASAPVAASWTAFNAPNLPFVIGRSNTFYLAGSIDDVRIYGRALSASEISQLVAGGAK